MRNPKNVLVLVALTLLLVLQSSKPALAVGLVWRGTDISKKFGIFEGLQLPLSSTGAFFTYTNQVPAPYEIPGSLNFGFILGEYINAKSLNDPSGHKVSGVGQLDAEVIAPREIYVWPWQPQNKQIRFSSDIIVPIAVETADTSGVLGLPRTFGAGTGGIADIFLAPFELALLDLVPKEHGGDKVGMTSVFWPFVQLPTGDYSNRNALNLGNNAPAFVMFSEDWVDLKFLNDLTFNPFIIYTHQFTNGHFTLLGLPSFNKAVTGKTTSSFQKGDSFMVNLDTEYPLVKDFFGGTLRVGVATDFLKQLSPDSLDGSQIIHSEEAQIAVGPEMYWNHGGLFLGMRYTTDVLAKNTYNRSATVWISLIYAFSLPSSMGDWKTSFGHLNF